MTTSRTAPASQPPLATEASEGDVEMDPAPECGTGSLSRAFVMPCQYGRRISFRDELPWVDVVRTYNIDSAAQPLPTFCRSGYGTCFFGIKFMDGIFNLAASFVVAGACVCNSEALLGCMITIFSMIFYWEYGQSLAVQMNWNIVSLAVIFPITQGIGWGFRRRELALRDLSELLGCCRSVWEAVFTWQIQVVKDKETKAKVWVRCVEAYDDQEQATRDLHQLWHSFLAALITYFDVARGGRARHTVGWHADEQAALIMTLREQARRMETRARRPHAHDHNDPPPPPPPAREPAHTLPCVPWLVRDAALVRRRQHLADAPADPGPEAEGAAGRRGAPRRQLHQHDGDGV